jgi:hypothetical protein
VQGSNDIIIAHSLNTLTPSNHKLHLGSVMAHYKPDSKNFAALQGSVVVITGMYSTASV